MSVKCKLRKLTKNNRKYTERTGLEQHQLRTTVYSHQNQSRNRTRNAHPKKARGPNDQGMPDFMFANPYYQEAYQVRLGVGVGEGWAWGFA